MTHYLVALDPAKTDPRNLNRSDVLRQSDRSSQLAFAYSVLEARGFFRSGAAPELDLNRPPLLTWPFLDFIDSLDLQSQSLVELGSGSSTAWFAKRFRTVKSFETNPAWHSAVSAQVGAAAQVMLIDPSRLEAAEISYAGEDWLVVDFAGKRTRFLKNFFARVPAPQRPSAIVLDNADWYRNGAAILAGNNYVEIPFYGFKSTQHWNSCTSVFMDPERFRNVPKAPFFQPALSRLPLNAWDAVD
jgi:hypothetical protein